MQYHYLIKVKQTVVQKQTCDKSCVICSLVELVNCHLRVN